MKYLLGSLLVGVGLFFIFPAQAKQTMQLASVSVGFSFGSGGYHHRGYGYRRGYRRSGYRHGYYPRRHYGSGVNVGFVFAPGDAYGGCRAYHKGRYYIGRIVPMKYDYACRVYPYGKIRHIYNYREY